MFRKSVLSLFVILIWLGVACTAGGGRSREVPDLGTIKVGYLPVTGYGGFFVAVDKGYFKDQGVEVVLERFDTGSKMIAPLSAGQLDVGMGEPGTALFNAIHQGLEVRVVCGTSAYKEGFAQIPVVVRKDLVDSGEITRISDLAGRKIGINTLRGMGEYSFSLILGLGGLTVDDVEFVTIPFPDIPAALANKALDAAYLPSPMAEKAAADGIAIRMFGSDYKQNVQNGVMYYGKRFLDPANREVAYRFTTAYLKAVRELMGDGFFDEQNLTIINKYTSLPIEVIKSTIRTYQDPNCDVLEESLIATQAFYVSRGYTEYSQPIPIDKILDVSFKEEALERLGIYDE